jgi:hypothetical protein
MKDRWILRDETAFFGLKLLPLLLDGRESRGSIKSVPETV